MKRLPAFCVLAILLAPAASVVAAEAITGCYPLALGDADGFKPPVFASYPAADIFKGRPAKLVLDTPDARVFRTMLKQEAAYGPDFAGHYKLARWGCGASCTYWGIIDSETGNVFFPPANMRAFTHVHVDDGGFEYTKASALLILMGDPDSDESGDKEGIYYYRWQTDKLRLLRFIPSRKKWCK